MKYINTGNIMMDFDVEGSKHSTFIVVDGALSAPFFFAEKP